MEKAKLSHTALICRYAVCLALMVACSQIVIPTPFTPVPVTLAVFMVFVIGGLLGPIHGTLCMMLYVTMGLIGLPVFAGFGSTASIVGPTGGYIAGYIPMTALVGLGLKSKNSLVHFAGMAGGLAVLYLFGTAWFSIYASITFAAALMSAVVPFILADLAKMALAYIVVRRLRRIRSLKF